MKKRYQKIWKNVTVAETVILQTQQKIRQERQQSRRFYKSILPVACAVFLLLLGGIFYPGFTKKTFAVTAYAADGEKIELLEGKEINLKITPEHFVQTGTEKNNAEFFYQISFFCEGEDIETITYTTTVENGSFWRKDIISIEEYIYWNNHPEERKREKIMAMAMPAGAETGSAYALLGNSYTVAYTEQRTNQYLYAFAMDYSTEPIDLANYGEQKVSAIVTITAAFSDGKTKTKEVQLCMDGEELYTIRLMN